MINPYRVLGVTPTTPKEQIKKAYLRLCKINHPDAGGNQEKFIEIKQAWEMIDSNNIVISRRSLKHTSVFDFAIK